MSVNCLLDLNFRITIYLYKYYFSPILCWENVLFLFISSFFTLIFVFSWPADHTVFLQKDLELNLLSLQLSPKS